MRMQRMLLGMIVLIACAGCATTKSGGTIDEYKAVKEPTYRLEAPDEIEISVLPQSELDRKVVIRPDGKISLPLIGDVVAEGLTPGELSTKLTEEFSNYVKNPSVAVIVTEFNSKKIFVIGEVFKEGAYAYDGETTVFEAVEQAGSFTRRASLGRVILVRGDLENPQVIDVNLKAVVRKGIKRKDLYLQPNDIVFIPPNGFAKTGYAIQQALFPFTPILGIGWDIGAMRNVTDTF